MKKKINIIFLILSIVISIVAVSVFFSLYLGNEKSINSLFATSSNSFESGWRNQYGLNFDVSAFSVDNIKFDEETPLLLYKSIPEFSGDAAMFYRTNNLVVNVYLDDECVYFVSDNGYYNDLSSFSSYAYIPFSQEDVGKTIMLEIYKTPISLGLCIDNFIFGHPKSVMFNAFSGDMTVTISGILTLLAGIVFFWMGIISRNTYEHFRGLLFIGMFCIFAGAWFLVNTLWVYNSFRNISLIEDSSHIFLFVCVPCFMMYIYDFFNIRNKKFYITLTSIGVLLFISFTILNLTRIMSFGYSVFVYHAYIVTCVITILAEMISYLSSINGNKGESKIFNIGIIFFVSLVLLDVGRFYQGNEGDSSLLTRFGVFVLIVTAVAATSTDIVDLLKLGIQAGKIGKIAYTDANTGLGNSAAFKSKFEELDRTKGNYSYIGIIQFDVNNLKIINDSLGHEAGDLLIKTAAGIIDETFGTIANCYRVGGDEFVAITTYNHAPLACEEAITKFESAIDRFNNNADKPFDLRIAYGVAYYQNSSSQFQSLKEVHKLADQRMYNKKKELKARFAKTPEEATIR